MNRRTLLFGTAALALPVGLLGCASAGPSLETAKAYLDAGTGAVLAAAQQYLLGPPPPSAANAAIVKQTMAALATAQTALDGTVVEADWRANATKALADINKLEPFVSTFLGASAPYIPLVIAVVSAFINGLPAPANAPPTPPAALRRKAAEYRHG